MQHKPLKLYIDENIAPQMAQALALIQAHMNLSDKKEIEVLSIKNVFGEGAKDEEWIPLVGGEHGVVVTFDRMIQRSRHQKQLYNDHGVGVIFLKAPKNGLSFWQMFRHLVDRWEEIKTIVAKNKPPFAFRESGHGKAFEKWDIE